MEDITIIFPKDKPGYETRLTVRHQPTGPTAIKLYDPLDFVNCMAMLNRMEADLDKVIGNMHNLLWSWMLKLYPDWFLRTRRGRAYLVIRFIEHMKNFLYHARNEMCGTTYEDFEKTARFHDSAYGETYYKSSSANRSGTHTGSNNTYSSKFGKTTNTQRKSYKTGNSGSAKYNKPKSY